MNKFIYLITCFLFININSINGQTLLNENQIATYINIPQEKVFVHYNSSLLFSGDYLHYKVYNINSQSEKLSHISKVVYVELIDSKKSQVFKHKVYLKKGLGQGDFFIPTNLASGNYKLIAYTRWMKNVGDFFQGDISILNPFIKIQNSNIEIIADSSFINNSNTIKETDKLNKYIDITLNANIFKKREEVKLTIKTLTDKLSFGNYSISVTKKDSIHTFSKPNSETYKINYFNYLKDRTSKSTVFLPELRGEIIKGVLTEKATGKPIRNKKISLSITGENSIFKISVTNALGVFYFNLGKVYNSENANINLIEDNPESYEIKIIEDTPIDYNHLIFNDFNISPKMKQLILDRSINNQIENAYSIVKQNRIIKTDQIKPFYEGEGVSYSLDDYTRFPTVKETIIEIVKELSTEKRKGINTFKIKSDQPTDKTLSALIIVDGLLIVNPEDLFFYDARKIKTISVVNKKYKYGGGTYSGILSVETLEGDFKKNIPNNYNSQNINLTKPEVIKEYYKQTYNDSISKKRIPDFRSQLLWEPNLSLDQQKLEITFFTSDYSGHYEINIEGFTHEGIPISLKEIITVK